MAKDEDTPPKQSKIKQIVNTYRMARKGDRWLGWVTLAVFLVVVAAFVGLGFLFLSPIILGIFGVPIGAIAAMVVFGRRVERSMYGQLEGQPGAAAAALQTLRRGWTVTPAIAVTRNQDAVHRVIGRPGIVLVGEGAPSRVAVLLAQEKKKHSRVAGDFPVFDIIVGDAPNQVPLRKVSQRIMKLPRSLRPAQVGELNFRLKAMPSSPIAIPKGPLPRNIKMPKGGLSGR